MILTRPPAIYWQGFYCLAWVPWDGIEPILPAPQTACPSSGTINGIDKTKGEGCDVKFSGKGTIESNQNLWMLLSSKLLPVGDECM
jgi:hypothetical protein